MSEITENPVAEQETPGTPDTPQETPVASTSVLNLAIESVMDEIDKLHAFAPITRGALGTDNGLACEIAPSYTSEVYMDKNSFEPVTLAMNGKHHDLRLLSDTLNNIMDSLSRRTTYPSGNGWEIVDITKGLLPRIIGREQNNAYLMAADLVIKIYRKDDAINESDLGE